MITVRNVFMPYGPKVSRSDDCERKRSRRKLSTRQFSDIRMTHCELVDESEAKSTRRTRAIAAMSIARASAVVTESVMKYDIQLRRPFSRLNNRFPVHGMIQRKMAEFRSLRGFLAFSWPDHLPSGNQKRF